jgi:hypothetical protein
MIKITSILTIFAVSFLVLSSCKKGCTNAKAYNYDKNAKEEDASCLFCDSVTVGQFETTKLYTDNTSSSPHQSEQVLAVIITGELESYRGNSCVEHGFYMNCDGQKQLGNFTHLSCKFTNLIGDTLVLTGNFRIRYLANDSVNEVEAIGLAIPPFSHFTAFEDKYYDCILSSSSSFSITTTSTPQYVYK